jgi:hypothetical protein
MSLLNYIRSNCSNFLCIMLGPMDGPSSNRTLVSLIKNKTSNHPRHWNKVFMRLSGLIEYLNIVLLRSLLLSLFMDMRLSCL